MNTHNNNDRTQLTQLAATQARQQSQKITSTAIALLRLGFTPAQVKYVVSKQRARKGAK